MAKLWKPLLLLLVMLTVFGITGLVKLGHADYCPSGPSGYNYDPTYTVMVTPSSGDLTTVFTFNATVTGCAVGNFETTFAFGDGTISGGSYWYDSQTYGWVATHQYTSGGIFT